MYCIKQRRKALHCSKPKRNALLYMVPNTEENHFNVVVASREENHWIILHQTKTKALQYIVARREREREGERERGEEREGAKRH